MQGIQKFYIVLYILFYVHFVLFYNYIMYIFVGKQYAVDQQNWYRPILQV